MTRDEQVARAVVDYDELLSQLRNPANLGEQLRSEKILRELCALSPADLVAALPKEKPVICEMCGDNVDYYAGDTAQSDRESLAALMIKHSFVTGHGETHADLILEFDWQLTELRNRAAQPDAEEAQEISRQLNEWASGQAKQIYGNRDLMVGEYHLLQKAAALLAKRGESHE